MATAMMTVPIEETADGVRRVIGTRVTLDTIVTAFVWEQPPRNMQDE